MKYKPSVRKLQSAFPVFFAVIRSSLGHEEIVASSGNREVLKGCVERTQKETAYFSVFLFFFSRNSSLYNGVSFDILTI